MAACNCHQSLSITTAPLHPRAGRLHSGLSSSCFHNRLKHVLNLRSVYFGSSSLSMNEAIVLLSLLALQHDRDKTSWRRDAVTKAASSSSPIPILRPLLSANSSLERLVSP